MELSLRLNQAANAGEGSSQHTVRVAVEARGATMGVVSGDPLSIAYYVTGHGLGHATRTIEVRSPFIGRSLTVLVRLPAGT